MTYKLTWRRASTETNIATVHTVIYTSDATIWPKVTQRKNTQEYYIKLTTNKYNYFDIFWLSFCFCIHRTKQEHHLKLKLGQTDPAIQPCFGIQTRWVPLLSCWWKWDPIESNLKDIIYIFCVFALKVFGTDVGDLGPNGECFTHVPKFNDLRIEIDHVGY